MSIRTYTTIKILTWTHPKLKAVAAYYNESMSDFLDRMIREEFQKMVDAEIALREEEDKGQLEKQQLEKEEYQL